MNNYSDIEFRINLLYDVVYNEQKLNCYNMLPIIKNNLSLIDLKEPEQINLEHVFDKDIKYVEERNDRYYFTRYSESSYSTTLVIGKYSHTNINNMEQSAELYNVLVHYVLSDISINEKIRHVMLPIMFFDIHMKKLEKLNKNVYEALKKNNISDEKLLNVFIYEHYFETVSLEKYLKNELDNFTLNDWKILFFQVFYILAKINENHGMFRHNKLDLNSIKIYKKSDKRKIYKLGRISFLIANAKFEIKLTDFYDSKLENYKNLTTTKTKDVPYYDIYSFIGSLGLFLEKEKKNIPETIHNFMTEMIHPKFRIDKNVPFEGLDETMFAKISSQMLDPLIILTKNNFFTEFIMNSPIEKKNARLQMMSKKNNDIEYRSPIDDGGSRMLGRRIDQLNKYNSNQKKKSRQYNKTGKMKRNITEINGVRKMILPKFEQTDSVSDTGIFKKAEKATQNEILAEAGSKKEMTSSTSVGGKESSPKHSKHSESSSSSSLSMTLESARHESNHHKRHAQHNNMSHLKNIDKGFAEKLANAPSNLVAEVPLHIQQQLNGAQEGYSGMGMMPGQGMPMGMMPGQGMPMGMMPGQGMPMGMMPGQEMPMGMAPGQGMGMMSGQEMPMGMAPGQGMPMPMGMAPGQGMPMGMAPGQGMGMPGQEMANPQFGMPSNGLNNIPMMGYPGSMGGGGYNDKKYVFVDKNGKNNFFF